ncbi:UvrD-helicase domain-containing protein [Shewanella sp. 1CM18E]|uniref:UvrD-helicase domain-containing protein n=1 Tax=Shewanella sp. 1CM18E TaxID=2929169 RepID=UPI0020BDD68A|nr:UvrD-helicase domain-containing protein [Shewanella sp. 1CM18E]MCK8045469.1 UvrD-helicase domain-containing protein [Shewanella sp. 1CM18E]
MELRRHSVQFGFLQGVLFCNSAHLCDQGLSINGKLYTYPDLSQTVEVRRGWFTLSLVWGKQRFRFFHFTHCKPLLRLALDNRLAFHRAELQQAFDLLLLDAADFDKEFSAHQRYLRDSDKRRLQQKYKGAVDKLALTEHFQTLGFDINLLNCRLVKFIKQPDMFTTKYNQWWQNQQLKVHKGLFDSIEAHPLTELQRQACVIDENNTLVIAGAGTGKTSTMAAKAAYLVNQGLAKPDDILMLAYGKDARQELSQRVLSSPELTAVKVSTFHALGKEIIQSYLKSSTQVSVLASDEKQFTQFIDSQIDCIVADPDMADPVAEYFGRYLYPQRNELDFRSEGQYRSYLKNNEIRALSGDLVKSFQELVICNYLYTHGIQFDYEPKYPGDVSEPGKSVYQPDFYIPVLDAYLEHFGIDKQGNTRADIDKDAYNQSREWKIALHQQHGSYLMQTFSWQADAGKLESSLEELLCARADELGLEQSQVFKPISPKEVFSQVKALGVYRNVSRLMASFVSLFKASGMSLAQLKKVKLAKLAESSFKPVVDNTIQAQQSTETSHKGDLNTRLHAKLTATAKRKNKQLANYNQQRWSAFLHLFSWVIKQYQAYLNEHNSLDFSDMIAKANQLVANKDFHQQTADGFRFKYIMVDEFQDISAERAELVKALRDASPNCALFCVGDDWQAIYRFAGSDLSLTTAFEAIFGAAQTVTLDKTFRFNNQIEKVASRFIQVNPAQLSKQLTTHSKSDNPEVCLLINTKEAALQQAFASIIEQVADQPATVMLISRFKSSLKELNIWQQRFSQLSISAMTAHASKGKQADFVIVLDVNDDKYGFPSKIDNDPILDVMLPALDSFKDSEERRLFYVALSRAKQRVFVQAELGKESSFIKELQAYTGDVNIISSELAALYQYQASCPSCQEGKLIPRQGRFGLFYTCSLGKDYCDTKVEVCPECKTAPLVRNQHHFICSSEACNHQIGICPQCNSGKLKTRTNSKTGEQFLACSAYKKADPKSCQYTCKLADSVKTPQGGARKRVA